VCRERRSAVEARSVARLGKGTRKREDAKHQLDCAGPAAAACVGCVSSEVEPDTSLSLTPGSRSRQGPLRAAETKRSLYTTETAAFVQSLNARFHTERERRQSKRERRRGDDLPLLTWLCARRRWCGSFSARAAWPCSRQLQPRRLSDIQLREPPGDANRPHADSTSIRRALNLSAT